MVDRDLVRRRVADLDSYLGQLGEVTAIAREAYLDDWRTQRVVERTLQLAIEVSMDLADHIIADRRLVVPETAAGTFELLGREGVIETSLAVSLARMVRFRNILVHDYVALDPVKVFQAATTDLRDIVAFRDIVLGLA